MAEWLQRIILPFSAGVEQHSFIHWSQSATIGHPAKGLGLNYCAHAPSLQALHSLQISSTFLCQKSRISLLTTYETILVPDLVFRWGMMENEWGFFRDALTALEENAARLQIQCRTALKAQYVFTIVQWPSFVYMAVVPRTPRMDEACITADSVRRRWACILPFLLMLHISSNELNWRRPDCHSHWLGNKMT